MSLQELVHLVFQKRENVFLTGVGGTGKSFLMKKIFELAKKEGMETELTSTTGISSYNIGGMTIHRWAGVQTGEASVDQLLSAVYRYKHDRAWKSIELLMIDEVSMLGQSLFEKLDYIARTVRQSPDVFGGIQLVVSGDFLQLPPIQDEYPFQSEVWDELDFKVLKCTKPYRYPDNSYFEMLLRIRLGVPTEQDIQSLQSRAKVRPKSVPTCLFSKKYKVDQYNRDKLKELKEDPASYQAVDSVVSKRKKFMSNTTTKVPYDSYFRDIIPSIVTLKKGCEVMLLKNLDVTSGLVNGSRGTVVECFNNRVRVRFHHTTHPKGEEESKEEVIVPIAFDVEDKHLRATRLQIPLILAYSLTIHKVQGLTLDECVVDLGRDVFSANMAYVALSRCKRLTGLYLTEFNPKSIYADKRALAFEETKSK